jgi:ABC-type transport system involved in Fe-S cluster assembly fused permease/ATPase subunit
MRRARDAWLLGKQHADIKEAVSALSINIDDVVSILAERFKASPAQTLILRALYWYGAHTVSETVKRVANHRQLSDDEAEAVLQTIDTTIQSGLASTGGEMNRLMAKWPRPKKHGH